MSRRNVPCAGCGTLRYGGRGVLPPGQQTCQTCRAKARRARQLQPATCPGCWMEFLPDAHLTRRPRRGHSRVYCRWCKGSRPYAEPVAEPISADRLKPCGTPAAYNRHLRNGERPCQSCTLAMRIDRRRRYRRRPQRRTKQVPYDAEHARMRKTLLAALREGVDRCPWPDCPYPGRRMYLAQKLDAGHVIARMIAGGAGGWRLEHASCNRRHGALLGNAARTRQAQVAGIKTAARLTVSAAVKSKWA